MDIRVLRYFTTVVNEKNISNASKVLYVTQPTLSRQLKELEDELGVTLFERGKKEIILTEDGKYLLSRANEIIALFDKTLENINSPESVKGDIHIGCGETKAMKIVASVIKSLSLDYPNINIHLVSGVGEEIIDKMKKGLLDFGIIVGPTNDRDFDSMRLPFLETWGVLTSRDSSISHLYKIEAKDLKGIPLIASKQISINQDIRNWMGKYYDSYNFIGSYTLMFNASFLVEENIASALTIKGVIENIADRNLKFIPFHPVLSTNLSIIWKKNQRLSKAAQLFLNFYQARMKDTENI